MVFSVFSVVKGEVPDNDQERSTEEADVVGGQSKMFITNYQVCIFIVFLLSVLLHHQEGSDHEEGEDPDGEEEDSDMAAEDTSEESDSEELEEKGKSRQTESVYIAAVSGQ